MNVRFLAKFSLFICQFFSFAVLAGIVDYSNICFHGEGETYDSFYCQCLRGDQVACDDPRSDPLFVYAIRPTRLSFATFASQNGYLATAQVVTDHLYKKRFSPHKESPVMVARDLPLQGLTADASSKTCSTNKTPILCKEEGYFTGWLAPFGEYAYEKPAATGSRF